MSEVPAGARLLVTGAGGFVGRHVFTAHSSAFSSWTLVAAPASFDVRQVAQVADLIADVRPTAVLHLAAQSFVPRSFANPVETLDINVLGTANLLQGLSATGFAGRLLFVSSGDVYGLVPDAALPVSERRMPEPRNPYAVSKVAAEQLTMMWHRAHGMDVVVARPFNHIGPGQDTNFAVPSFARQIVDMAEGRIPLRLEAGDIDTTRDFTDVRDVVAAYGALLMSGVPGRIYNVASGVEHRMRGLIETMCKMAGVSPEIVQDPTRMRPAEQRRMVADTALLQQDTGWSPAITIEQTLEDVMNDARGRV